MEHAREKPELGARTASRTELGRRAVLVGAAAWGVGALASACTASPATPPSPVTSGSPPPLPQSPALRLKFVQTAKELLTPGAVITVRTPDGEMSATYGSRTDTGSVPVTLADHVRIGSITKTFTGTVILQLAQEGKLNIDAPVTEYRPDVPNGDKITLTQLLDMRSGLYNYSESVDLNKALDDDPAKVWTPAELLTLGLKYPAYFPPGTDFHYSNTNFVLLGLIIEQLDKRPLGSVYQTRLFTPLAMHETSFPPAADTAIPAPHPRGYMYGTNVETMKSEALSPDQQAAAKAGTLKPHDVTDSTIVGLGRRRRHLHCRGPRHLGHSTQRRDAAQRDLAAQATRQRPVDQPRLTRRGRLRSGHRQVRPAVRPHRRAARIPVVHRPRPGSQDHSDGMDKLECCAGRARACRHDRPTADRRDLRLTVSPWPVLTFT